MAPLRRPARPFVAPPRTLPSSPASRPLALAAFALAAAACGDAGDKGKPAPSPPPSAPVATLATPNAPAPPPSAPASAQPLGRRLACERLLPEAARDRLLPGYVMRQGAKCPECGPECTFTHPSRPYEGVQASLVCNEAFDAKKVKDLSEPLRTSLRKAGPVKGFGRGGVHGEKEFGTFYTVLAFDDDSDCRVSIDWMRGDRDKALELAKAALAGVKQADLR
ncbi:MAG TPA: hypothetical protein VFS43_25575 [Polyangiaceae bacterium]|nr:hypothetical protein [Polyangiaceae bacterium]